jgi:hypothetical protein
MLGSVIKYVGMPEDERYPAFIGHVGYVTSYFFISDTGESHVGVRWFEPRPVHFGWTAERSHFSLARFEILSGPHERDEHIRD